MKSTAKHVEEYIDSHPSIKNCLKKDLINFSSLSRQVISELGVKKKSSFDAVLVSLRRVQEKMKTTSDYDKNIKKILSSSKLEIKTGVSVVVVSNKIQLSALNKLLDKISEKNGTYHIIHGSATITTYTSDDFVNEFKSCFHSQVLYSNSGLVQLNLKTSEEIITSQGVMAFVFSLLSENNINVIDCITSWTDNIFIINEDDISKCVQLLKF